MRPVLLRLRELSTGDSDELAAGQRDIVPLSQPRRVRPRYLTSLLTYYLTHRDTPYCKTADFMISRVRLWSQPQLTSLTVCWVENGIDSVPRGIETAAEAGHSAKKLGRSAIGIAKCTAIPQEDGNCRDVGQPARA